MHPDNKKMILGGRKKKKNQQQQLIEFHKGNIFMIPIKVIILSFANTI